MYNYVLKKSAEKNFKSYVSMELVLEHFHRNGENHERLKTFIEVINIRL